MAADLPPGSIPRSHPRVPLDAMAQAENPQSGASCLGRAENISVGGLGMRTRETFDPSIPVVVRFNLPGYQAIETPGVVKHAQPGRHMGIQFVETKDPDRKAIEQFVRKLSPP